MAAHDRSGMPPPTQRTRGACMLQGELATARMTAMRVQDAWDWMVQHWCDRSERIWPVQQIEHPKLDLNRPQEWAGAAYTHAARRAKGRDAYTLRSRHYALLYHSFRGGPDPKEEMDWARVRPPPPTAPARSARRAPNATACPAGLSELAESQRRTA